MSSSTARSGTGDPTANKYAEALGTETAVWDAGVPALFVKVSWRPASRSPRSIKARAARTARPMTHALSSPARRAAAREGDPGTRGRTTTGRRFATALLCWIPFPSADCVGSGRG